MTYTILVSNISKEAVARAISDTSSTEYIPNGVALGIEEEATKVIGREVKFGLDDVVAMISSLGGNCIQANLRKKLLEDYKSVKPESLSDDVYPYHVVTQILEHYCPDKTGEEIEKAIFYRGHVPKNGGLARNLRNGKIGCSSVTSWNM